MVGAAVYESYCLATLGQAAQLAYSMKVSSGAQM